MTTTTDTVTAAELVLAVPAEHRANPRILADRILQEFDVTPKGTR
jgi:hypothetical protein